jgi:pSer/pThr/pTyr-binding forkhead associated (FHA) protein
MSVKYQNLKILSSKDRGSIFLLKKKENKCGRAETNDLVLNDSSVSSEHCIFIRNDTSYTVHDVGSTNGTLVNNEAITAKLLKNKDVITVGKVELLYDDVGLDHQDSKLEQTSVAIDLNDESISVPLDTMKNFSPFAGAKTTFLKKTMRIILFICIGLVVAAIGLLVWILLHSM